MAGTNADVEVLKAVVSKLDTSIERIAETSGQISQLLAVHEQRLNDQEKKDYVLEADVKVLHKRITETTEDIIKELQGVERRLGESGMEQHNQLSKEINAVGDRVNGLEKWKWYIVGAIIGISIVSQSPMLESVASILK